MKKYLLIGTLLTASLLVAFALAIPVIVVSLNTETTYTSEKTATTLATPENLLERVNMERSSKGIEPLILEEGVQTSAQLKSDDMLTRDYRSHFLPESPEATLTTEMYSHIEPICISSGENYYYTKENTPVVLDDAIAGWLNSPPHKAAILNPEYTKTGFGVSQGVVVQHFCVAR